MGLVTNYKVKVESNKLSSLNEDFRFLSDMTRKEKINNKDILSFEKQLSKLVRNDFKRRYSSNDSDTDID